MLCRVAVSTRVVRTGNYLEVRDALSHEWYTFLSMCGITPILIPNIVDDIETYLCGIEISGIVLSGGNNLCPVTYGEDSLIEMSDAYIERDRTEKKLIELAVSRKLAVIGVCRGMQMLNAHFRGKILRSIKKKTGGRIDHVASIHEVKVRIGLPDSPAQKGSLLVNSFHDQGFTAKEISPDFSIFAETTRDGVVEGIFHNKYPILGIQWHPERKNSDSEFDVWLFESIFKNNMYNKIFFRSG